MTQANSETMEKLMICKLVPFEKGYHISHYLLMLDLKGNKCLLKENHLKGIFCINQILFKFRLMIIQWALAVSCTEETDMSVTHGLSC